MNDLKIEDFNNHKITDKDVINRIISGDKELYEILLRRNNQKLYRVIRSYLNERQEIEDVMQNTYLKAYENLSMFKQNSQFSTWLIRIGINQALALLKTKSKHNIINNNSNDIDSNTILNMPNRDRSNPEKKIIRQEAKQFIEDAIDSLSPKYKVVYVMREIEGMSINEIAESLDLSTSNIKVRLHRAKAILKEQLYELSLNNDVFEFGFSRCDRLTEWVMRRIL